jgi:hypothetical protein
MMIVVAVAMAAMLPVTLSDVVPQLLAVVMMVVMVAARKTKRSEGEGNDSRDSDEA